MIPPDLATRLTAAIALLPAEFRATAARLWQAEHLQRLSARILGLCQQVIDRPPPNFEEEITPPLESIVAPWRELLARGELPPTDRLAQQLESTGLDQLLLLLGLRRTPGSLSGAEAIPPTREELLAAAEIPHIPGLPLCVAARAWTKHVPRSSSEFWGQIRGTPQEQNRVALSLVQRILNEGTWWNVYGHYKQGIVFESRIPSGHGARWQVAGPAFIGFVEPFLAGGLEAQNAT